MSQRPTRPFLLIALLLSALLSACGTPPGSGDTGTSPISATPTASPGTPVETTTTSTTMPATETSCPAAGKGRTAVKVALPHGSTANVVYVFNKGTDDSPVEAILRRYDSATGTKHDIISLPQSTISGAQLSEDGQWILFTRHAADLNKDLFQLIRIDGQGLQTLYCSPFYSASGSTLLFSVWSFNGGSLIFNEGSTGMSDSEVKLLEVDSGNVRLLLQKTGPGLRGLFATAWVDNFNVYLTGFVPNSDAPLLNVYLLNTGGPDNQPTSAVPTLATVTGPCYSYDSNYNRTRLYVSNCNGSLGLGSPVVFTGPSKITDQPATAGGPTTVVNEASRGIFTIRSIANDSLLVYIKNTTTPADEGIYKLTVSTSTFTKLASTASDEYVSFNGFSQAPWSTMNQDRTKYAFVRSKFTSSGSNYNLAIGNLSGGAPTTIASYMGNGSVNLIGWANL